MKVSRLLLLTAPALLLSACATTPAAPPPAAVLSITGKTCVNAPDLSGAISLTPATKKAYYSVSTSVDSAKPCLTSVATSGNYVVYAIPAHGENHTITVGGVEEAARTFAPSISLLDTDGKVTRTFADDRYTTYGEIFGIQFVPQPQERYILVQSNADIVGRGVTSVDTRIAVTSGYSPATPASYGFSYQQAHGFESKHNRVFSHEGQITVIVQAAKGKIGLPDDK